MVNLLMHCGGRHVSREDVLYAPTPLRTHSWVPVPHHHLLELVERLLSGYGYQITGQAHGLWGQASERYFGLMELSSRSVLDHEGYRLVLGLRNSHDKSFPASLALDSQVRAIFAIARRHGIEPESLAKQRFRRKRLEDLSVREASALIDELKRVSSEEGS